LVVHGVVGSGKSTLLQALLGELTPTLGSGAFRRLNGVHADGAIAYVAQECWLPNATVRDVILFHRPLDLARYQAVLEACALGPDLDSWPAGDHTEVGEAGLTLSGGQRVRLALARACYAATERVSPLPSSSIGPSATDTMPRIVAVLLDDPLSAVDAHVAAHLVEHVLGPRGLLRHVTRVLVSHHVDLLRPHVHRLVQMEGSRIVREEIGGSALNGGEADAAGELGVRVDHDSAAASAGAEVAASAVSSPSALVDSSPDPASDFSSAAAVLLASPSYADAAISAPSEIDAEAEARAERALLEKGYLTAEESRVRGSIRRKVLGAYVGFVGSALCALILLSMVLMQASRNGSDWVR